MFLSDNPYYVACFSEIWLTSEQLLSAGISNYKLVNYFCRQKFKHGGVAIFVKENLDAQEIKVSHFCTELDAEFTAILNQSTIYRSNRGNFDIFLNSLDILLEFLVRKYENIILLGDFNVNFLADSKEKNSFNNILLSYNLETLFYEPMRVTEHSSTCIDNICINFTYRRLGIVKVDISDHYGQFIEVKIKNSSNQSKNVSKQIRHISEIGKAECVQYINRVDWTNYYQTDNPNIHSEFLCENITYAIETAFPLKNVNQKPQNLSGTRGSEN
ncbi:hypothetical protein JTB14_035148 [Gonioctena quinquepunctata]|nr:hypothetical protein JTB14_035148 [Gonioctena quinquepunctata]